jgi:uncharacterized protein
VCIFPLEVHVFEHDGVNYAFDSRNYAVFTVDDVAAQVLAAMRDHPLDAIVESLAPSVSADLVRAHYLRFLKMIEAGLISSQPVSRPQRPPFSRLVIMLAGGCNMGCSYCFERDVPIYQHLNLMTRETADRVLDWYFRHQQGPKAHVQLYGGEPTLNWPVLTHVVERAEAWAAESGKELTKYLITNGTLLNRERIAFLRAHHVSVQVSVDGDDATHNAFRVFKSGRPTMDQIRPNIQELKAQEVDVNLRAVLTSANRDPSSVIQGLRSHGVERVSFEVVATDHAHARLSKTDWTEFADRFHEHVFAPYTSWEELPDEVQSTIVSLCEGKHVHYGCGAGVSEVTVAPDGNIYECQRIYRQPYSNVAEDKGPKELDSRFLTMVDDRNICKSCWARYLCGGGCLHQSHIELGNADPVPQYCDMKYDLVEAAIVKIHELRARVNTTREADPAPATGTELLHSN